MRELRQQHRLTAAWRVKRFHREQFPLDGIMRLLQERAGHRHLGFEKRLAVAKELKGGRFVLKIDGDGPVFARRFGR